jgi:uncharacterized membrane protein YhaH (DUF805 family)
MFKKLINELKPHLNLKSILLNLKQTLTTFTIKGRSNRSEFLTLFTFNQIILLTILTLFASTGMNALFSEISNVNIESMNNPTMPTMTNYIIGTLIFCIISFVYVEIMLFLVIARRLHDSGRSAWWYLVIYAASLVNYIIPGSQILTTLFLGLLPAENRENKYGNKIKK